MGGRGSRRYFFPTIGVAGGGFNPAQLPGTKYRWIADDLIEAEDGAIASWANQLGAARPLAQANAGNRPIHKLTQINGHSVVRFASASSQWLATATTPTLAQPNTVFIVAKVNDPQVQQTFIDSTTDAQSVFDIPASTFRRFRIYAGSSLQSTIRFATSSYRVYDMQFSGASSTLYIDGILHASGDAGTSGFAGIKLGARGTAGIYFNGDVADLVVGNYAYSLAERAAVLGYYRGLYGSYQNRMLFDGDSLTFGSGSAGGNTYPAQCVALNGKTATNMAVAGETSGSRLYDTVLDAYSFGGLTLDDIFAYWIGTNDLLASIDPATVYANIVTIATWRYRGGFAKIIICTLPDCQGTGRPAGYDAARATLNASIIAGAAANHYTVARLDADTRLQNALDTTYFDPDKTHLNNDGYGVVAEIVNGVI